jgi:hypothetical protein
MSYQRTHRQRDAAREEYEQQHGAVEGPYALLHLASTHPTFAFLRPLSEFMVDLDMLLDDKDQPADAPETAQAVAWELRHLFGLGGEDAPLANR